MMKVYLNPYYDPTKPDKGQGGIKRVVEAQIKYLPEYGIEFVKDPRQADVANLHATAWVGHPNVVHSLHGFYWKGFWWEDWAYKANRQLLSILRNPNVKAVTSPSEWVAQSVRRGMLIDPKVIYHGIDIEEWKPLDNRSDYVVWAKTRIDPVCDVSPLNELARITPNVRYISTFGNSDLPNVTTIGKQPFPVIKPVLQQAKVYLANVMETGGITILEAMASGVVPLGYKWGVNPEIITHKENGYLVNPGDIEGLKEGLYYCLENWKRLSDASIQTVRNHFQWEHVIGGYADVYREAIQPHAGPSVSVIVTAYNLDKYLPACIESVLVQPYRDWELIIVDDCSPDRCGEIAEEYSTKDDRIKVIHNTQNAYLAEARNIGIRNSRGKYIIPLDADDRFGDDALGILARNLDINPDVDIVTGSMEYNEGDTWLVSRWPHVKMGYGSQIKRMNQVPYASMYRRWVWERTGGYRRRMRTTEDAEFWTRAMSYGAVPAKVTEKPTLVYLNRPESMSHTEAQPDWTAWFTWAKYEELTPFGASGAPKGYVREIEPYSPVKVSVIIPVGPGHDIYVQDALDSLVAQTLQQWEAIVINDTGETWFDEEGNLINPYLSGFSFVKFIEHSDPSKNRGVAWARNYGIAQSTADMFVLLDSDDYAQPAFLELLYKAQQKVGGWVYPDWYDQEGTRKYARDWDAEELLTKMLGPSIGIYEKSAWEKVGGFDEIAPGWEDYLFQLALLDAGVCGSRLAVPLFTYRYHTGSRREWDFAHKDDLLKYIKKKFSLLMKKGDHFMGCKKCGDGGGIKDLRIAKKTGDTAKVAQAMEMVEVEYIGTPTQTRRVRSRVDSRRFYSYGGSNRHLFVYKADADWMINLVDFRMAPKRETVDTAIEDLPVLVAERTPVKPKDEIVPGVSDSEVGKLLPVKVLDVSPEVHSILEGAGFVTIGEVPSELAELVSIKGIGKSRAEQILEAMNDLLA